MDLLVSSLPVKMTVVAVTDTRTPGRLFKFPLTTDLN